MHDTQPPHLSQPVLTPATSPHRVNYFLVFALLVLATFATLLVSLHRFQSESLNVLAALTLATIKASLVLLFFMHLKFEGHLLTAIALVPLLLSLLLVAALLPDVSFAHLFSPSLLTR